MISESTLRQPFAKAIYFQSRFGSCKIANNYSIVASGRKWRITKAFGVQMEVQGGFHFSRLVCSCSRNELLVALATGVNCSLTRQFRLHSLLYQLFFNSRETEN